MQKSLPVSLSRKFCLLSTLLLPLLALGSYSQPTEAQTLTTINSNVVGTVTWDGPLVEGSDGNFYGTTFQGGSFGTVFKMTSTGVLTTLASFDGFTGIGNPVAGLVEGSDGNFYGTTTLSESSRYGGAVFQMTPTGALKTIYDFYNGAGFIILGFNNGLLQGSDGNLYGTTANGGIFGYGTVYQLTPNSDPELCGGYSCLTTLINFNGTNGSRPTGRLVKGNDGNFYGVTSEGGSSGPCFTPYTGEVPGCGTIFKITPNGIFTTLVNFDDTNGVRPSASLLQGSDGNFYGSTLTTKFRMTPSGSLTTLVDNIYGNGSVTPFVQGVDGDFYTTFWAGGCCGSVLKMTSSGALTTISGVNGIPYGLTLGTDGNLYGRTQSGGTNYDGTVFVFNANPTTITSFSPASATGGATVTINGTNFTAPNTSTLTSGITAVQFNGINATSYTVKSATQITAVVPVNATTGPITLTTNTGITVNSSTNFKALPKVNSFSPTSGIANSSVVITGTNFLGTTSVKFNNTNAPSFTVNSATQITAKVPSTATSGPIRVTTPGGASTSTTNFRVLPKINSFTPTSGPAGAVVTLTGSGFTGATAVQFNGVAATFTVNSATKITATVPAGATSGFVRVATPTGIATSSKSFTVQ